MRVGPEILELACAAGAQSVFVVGTGRDAGKTTTLRAIYDAACAKKIRTGVASIGRDRPKPRLWLQRETIFVTTRATLPSTPASEILKLSQLRSPSGALLYARVAAGAFYDVVGPPTANGMREVVEELSTRTDIVVIDGAVDRVAAVAGSQGAIVVACGASGASTMHEAVDEIAALVARLRTAPFDPKSGFIEIEGALTPARAAALIAQGETRQIVVGDPTQIALTGKAAAHAFARLQIRCRRPLHVVAATVASIGADRSFEPDAFVRAVASATNLPTFDVYANGRVA